MGRGLLGPGFDRGQILTSDWCLTRPRPRLFDAGVGPASVRAGQSRASTCWSIERTGADLADEDGESGGGAQGSHDDDVASEEVDAAEDGADDGCAEEEEAGRVDGHEDDALDQRGGLRVRAGCIGDARAIRCAGDAGLMT